jgi:hypothetical protein
MVASLAPSEFSDTSQSGSSSRFLGRSVTSATHSVLHSASVASIKELFGDRTHANFSPWPKSASELYRQSNGHLSAKLVPIFANRGMSRSQRGGSPTAVISLF